MERRYFIKTDRIGIDNYLTMVALENGLQARLDGNDCEYCIDGNGVWKTLPASELTEPINARHTLSFRANLKPTSEIGVGTFAVNRLFNLKGNCMSLLYGDNVKENLSLPNSAFKSLFAGNDKLVSAKDLNLPTTNISAWGCYENMFKNCTALQIAPKLPATKVGIYGYRSMFNGCVSLTTVPELCAIELSNYSCVSMFQGCSFLESAPPLIATKLGANCYERMFSSCTSLIDAPKLHATELMGGCYNYMFSGCTSLTKAPELPAIALAANCYQGMFNKCTGLTTAPDLPAKTLINWCYSGMFSDCTSLNYIKMLATDISATGCLSNWTSGVVSSGTFFKAIGVNIANGMSGIPSGWTVIEE